jgi:hypothetical protein
MPLVFDMPKYVALITKEDKVMLVNKLMKEKKQIEMIKTLLEIAEHKYTNGGVSGERSLEQ